MKHHPSNLLRPFLVLALAAALLVPASVSAQANTGSADFGRYVALGDSLTAAFSSSGWVERVQRTSYPALINRQATGTTAGFEQPLLGSPGVPPPLRLVSLVPGPVLAPAPGFGQPLNLTLPRPYNNLGVPGAEVNDTVATVTDGGGPHDLVLRGLGTALQQAVALQPTLVTLWIGSNDVLAAATSGRVINGVTLTRPADFERDYRTIVNTLTAATGAQLVMANLPNVTSIPFVTTVDPFIDAGGTQVPLIGPAGPLGPNDRVLLTATTLLGMGVGVPQALGGTGLPLPDQVVLSAGELATIQARVNTFNNIIATVAGESGAVLVDINHALDELATEGIDIGGIGFTSEFLTGGTFSYDGVHANQLGYAIVANEFIEAINAGFGAEIPQVDLFPFIFGDTAALEVVFTNQADKTRITRKGWKNLKWVLDLPALSVIHQGPGGGGGSGGGGGGGGGTAPPPSKPQGPVIAGPRSFGR